MKLIQIEFEELFPTGVYANQRYRAIATIDERENITECYKALKDKIEDVFVQLNPQIQFSNPMFHHPTISDIEVTDHPTNGNLLVIREKTNPKEEAEQRMLEAINTCTELKVLETFKLLVKNNPVFQNAYNEKLKQFIPDTA